MITLRKLASLKEGTRQRKLIRLLEHFERNPKSAADLPEGYLKGIVTMAAEETGSPSPAFKESSVDLVRELNRLRHRLLRKQGSAPADWDMAMDHPGTGKDSGPDQPEFSRPLTLYLDDIRSPFNLGSIFRTAESLRVGRILLSADTPDPDHPRCRRSAMGSVEMIPWERLDADPGLEKICRKAGLEPTGDGLWPAAALEPGGVPADRFSYPGEGLLILGSEELGVAPGLLAECRKRGLGILSLRQYGRKGSLNVGVAAGIALNSWCEALPSR